MFITYDVEVICKDCKRKEKLWYSFDKEHDQHLCHEVSDGIIVTLLPYALRGGFDIKSEIPITEQLFYTLTRQLIPQLCLCNDVKESWIDVDTIRPEWHPTAVATAMSLGVDSFATFFEYSNSEVLSHYQITHLTFFENGAHHAGLLGHSERQEIIYREQRDKVRKFCIKNNYEFIPVSSNLDSFLCKLFWNDPYDRTHTYRNAGFVLLLQKLIRFYYYSPGYNINKFNCSIEEDSAHYERLLLPNISTEYTSFYNSNGSWTRLQKIRYISKHAETHNSLLVCYTNSSNCGECIKCKRTLVEMDILGVLPQYKSCFDLNSFKKNRRKYYVYCLSKRNEEELMKQIHEYIQENNVKIPRGSYILADLRGVAVVLYKWIRRFRNNQ